MQPLSLTLSYHFIYYRLSNSQRENRIFFFCVWALWRGSLSPSVWLIVRWFEWYLSLYCSEDRWRRWGAEWWRHERNKQWNVWFRVQLRTLVFARGCNKSWESFIKKKTSTWRIQLLNELWKYSHLWRRQNYISSWERVSFRVTNFPLKFKEGSH